MWPTFAVGAGIDRTGRPLRADPCDRPPSFRSKQLALALHPIILRRSSHNRRRGFRRSCTRLPVSRRRGRSDGLRLTFGNGRFGERFGHGLGALLHAAICFSAEDTAMLCLR